MQTHQIPINHIVVEGRIREELDATKMKELQESIQEHGLLQPIVVTKLKDGDYKLLCGFRRLTAIKNLGLSDISANIKEEMPNDEQMIVEYEENIKRHDFNDAEKIKAVSAIHKLMCAKRAGWRQEDTAKYLGYANKATVSVITKVAEHLESNPNSTVATLLGKGGKEGTINNAYKEIRRQEVAAVESALSLCHLEKASEQASRGVEGCEARAECVVSRGSCLDLIKEVQSGSVRLLHTDPPYGVDFNKLEKGSANKDMYQEDSIALSTDVWAQLVPEVWRVMAPDSFGVVWCSFVQMEMIRKLMEQAGFMSANKPFIWCKTSGSHACYAPSRWFASAYDSALIFSKGQPTLHAQGKDDFLLHPALTPNEKTHPLERPTPLLMELMGRFYPMGTGVTVLDPFCGSGSTLMAALKLGWNPIGFELEERFYNIAKDNVVQTLKAM